MEMGDKGKNMYKLVNALFTRRRFPTFWWKRDVDAK